jgi:hypothetical protein
MTRAALDDPHRYDEHHDPASDYEPTEGDSVSNIVKADLNAKAAYRTGYNANGTARWHVGAMNDALYIIDRPPAMGNDLPPDRPGGQNVIAGPFMGATLDDLNAICGAHNRHPAAPSLEGARHPITLIEDKGKVVAATADDLEGAKVLIEGARHPEAREPVDKSELADLLSRLDAFRPRTTNDGGATLVRWAAAVIRGLAASPGARYDVPDPQDT